MATKYKTFFIFLLFICNSALGDLSNVDLSEQTNIVNSVGDMYDDLNREYQEIADEVGRMYPEVIQNIEKNATSDFAKLSMLRSWLARESYEHYKQKIMNDMKQRSRETNRTIKHKNSGSRETVVTDTYWLDRGKLDAPECLAGDGYRKCYYPDNFEEYYFTTQESSTLYNNQDKYDGNEQFSNEITTEKDIPNKDLTFLCDIMLTINSSAQKTKQSLMADSETYFDASCVTETYTQRLKQRNLEVEDIITGRIKIDGFIPPNGIDYSEPKSNMLPPALVLGQDHTLYEHRNTTTNQQPTEQ